MKKISTFLLILWAIAIGKIKAQNSDSTAFTKNLQELTVTSSRMALSVSQLPQKINIISQKDIELTTAIDISDVVKKMASIDVVQYPQALSYISIRGFRPPAFAGNLNPESSILINGRQSGTYNLALIDPNSIERIEVLKGAAAAMYGSSAMGGIVNIILKKTTGQVRGSAYGGYGSFKTTEAGLSVGGSLSKRVDFDISASLYDRNDNFRHGRGNVFRRMLGAEDVTLTLANGTTVVEDDRILDGEVRNNTRMGNYSGMARLGFQFHKNWRVDVTGENYVARNIETAGDWHYGDAQQGISGRLRSSGEVAITGEVGKHTMTAKAFSSVDYSNTFTTRSGTNEKTIPTPTFQNSQVKVNWQGVQLQDVILATNNLRLILGADYTEARTDIRRWTQGTAAQGFPVTEGRPSTPNSYITTWAPFVQVHWHLFNRRLIVNPSFRYDFITFGIAETPNFTGLKLLTGNNTFASPSLGIQYNITEKLTAHSNIGRAFRYARAFEIAGYFEEYIGTNIRIQQGNPELKNEQSVTWDLGLRLSDLKKGYRFDVTYFSTNVQNRVRQELIQSRVGERFTSTLNGNTYTINRFQTFVNADQAQIRGLELEGGYDFGALNDYKRSIRVFANATHFFKAQDITKATEANPRDVVVDIRNVAKTTLGYGIEFDDMKSWQIRLTGRYVAPRFDNDFGNLDLARRGALIEYAPYMTLDLVVACKIQKQHTIALRMNNLTDENYYEKRGFNLPGRYTTLRYTFRF
ncbi:MAG: TonB-dependent receptor [Runella sp.]